MTGNKAQITYSSEVARKGIHLASLLIPIIYLQLDHVLGLAIVLAMTAVSITLDMLMHYNASTRRVLLAVVGPLLRKHELREDRFYLTGASWVLIAASMSFGVFPTIIGVTAFTVLIVSDTFAALIGRAYGERAFLDKSFVGTVTFITTAMIVVLTYAGIYDTPWTFIVAGSIASVVGGVTEAASTRLRIDDNISIPLSFAITMWVLTALISIVGLSDFSNVIP